MSLSSCDAQASSGQQTVPSTNPCLTWLLASGTLHVDATQACGREAECIQVYKTVEQTHPNKAVKKQAAELRYIMEAPKLQLRPEEKISLPLLENLDRYKYVQASMRSVADTNVTHLKSICIARTVICVSVFGSFPC